MKMMATQKYHWKYTEGKKRGGGAKTLFIQCKQQEKGQPRNPTGNVHKQPPDLSQQQHREVSVPAHKVGWSAWTSTPVKN